MEIIAIIILAIVLIILSIYCYHIRHQQQIVIEINKERQQENQNIELEIQQKRKELSLLNETEQNKHQSIQSLVSTENELQERVKRYTQQSFYRAKEKLDSKLREHKEQICAYYNNFYSSILQQIDKESQKLQDIEDKQVAYLEAQQRQQEIDNNKDYYRLNISETDLSDVAQLRDLQMHFFKKEAIDKLIWETYYKPAYDVLMSHVCQGTGSICGIYKITDLITGQVYVGQSVNIKERFRQHIKASLTFGGATNKLYQTMQKSGPSNFTFEVLEQIPRDKLNERETYWINFYKSREYGLNSTRGNNNGGS